MAKKQIALIVILFILDIVLSLFNVVLGFIGGILLFILMCNFKFNDDSYKNT